MFQINNRTPFAANIALLANENGIDTLYTIVKATFVIGQQWILADEQVPPQLADEYFAEPLTSSLKTASDFHIGKMATDVIMCGNACAREGYPIKIMDVELHVEKLHKKVRVFGNRYWDAGRISSPELFEQMPLTYENAYGGTHFEDGQIKSAELRNPVGRGYIGKQSASILNGTLLPNVEDPANLISRPGDAPSLPACFSYVAPNWHPRATFAGTYDDSWQETRAPFLPKDFNKRFLNCAAEGLVYNGFIQGGERVKITNMHPRGDLAFQIPPVHLKCSYVVNGKAHEEKLLLETLLLEPNDLKISFVWRSGFVADKKAHNVEEVQITLVR